MYGRDKSAGNLAAVQSIPDRLSACALVALMRSDSRTMR